MVVVVGGPQSSLAGGITPPVPCPVHPMPLSARRAHMHGELAYRVIFTHTTPAIGAGFVLELIWWSVEVL